MINIKRKLINIYNNGVLIDTFTVTDSTTAQQIAAACKITLTEAQTLLNGRITEDTNNFCCNSPLPIIRPTIATINYESPATVTFEVDFTNVDSEEYTIIIKENNTIIHTYTGIDRTVVISGIQMPPRLVFNFSSKIYDIEITTQSCAGETRLTETKLIKQDAIIYYLENGVASGPGPNYKGRLFQFTSFNNIITVSTGDNIQIQYFIKNQWFNETKQTISNSLIFNTPFTSLVYLESVFGPTAQFATIRNVPLYGRFRNLTTGSSWIEFGQQVPSVYP